MLRRLYFLFPDETHAQRAVDKLVDLNVQKRRIHAIAKDSRFRTLPQATQRQKNDTAFRIEWFLWTANLILFALALIGLITSLVLGEYLWGFAAFAVMAITFIAGEHFVIRVPNVHLNEFTDALSHGEILLMVDIPSSRVPEIEGFIHHKCPEATVGGVSWTVDAFGL